MACATAKFSRGNRSNRLWRACQDAPSQMSKPEPKRPPELPEPSGKRPEKGNSSNLFWFLMILAVVGANVFSFSSKWRGKTLTYSEFVKRLEDRTLHAANVFDLQRGHSAITFQDQPKNDVGSKLVPTQFTVSVGSMSDAEKKRAVQVARAAEGVTGVVDKLTIDPSVAPPEPPPANGATSSTGGSTNPDPSSPASAPTAAPGR